MTTLLSMIGRAWPTILELLVGVVGTIYGIFKHQQAATTKANAAKSVAEIKAATAQSNADASLAGADATKERINVENDIAIQPAGGSTQFLRDNWSRD